MNALISELSPGGFITVPVRAWRLFLSAKGAKCDSLGQRPRTGVSSQAQSAESAKLKESETKDMPQSLSSILIHLIFSTK
ncbi:MAG: hypothetical protein WAL47_06020, partial [Pyrinomonadaceae bacterium]